MLLLVCIIAKYIVYNNYAVRAAQHMGDCAGSGTMSAQMLVGALAHEGPWLGLENLHTMQLCVQQC